MRVKACGPCTCRVARATRGCGIPQPGAASWHVAVALVAHVQSCSTYNASTSGSGATCRMERTCHVRGTRMSSSLRGKGGGAWSWGLGHVGVLTCQASKKRKLRGVLATVNSTTTQLMHS